MYYAKSKPLEGIKEHTEKLLKNLKVLKEIYEKEIDINIEMDIDRFWRLLEIICIYHDLGKVYTPFQNVMRTKNNMPKLETSFSYETIKHEQLSPMFVPVKSLGLTEEEMKLVYQAIYYHHEREGKEIDNIYVRDIINEDIMPQIEKIKGELGYEIEDKISNRYINYVKNRIKEGDKLYKDYCLLKGLLHRLDHSSSAEMVIEDGTTQNIRDYVEKFMQEKKYEINDLQKFCNENDENNLLVIGSTGKGKTEGALLWSNMYKTFFTLPIRISINAIYDRIRDNLGYQHVGLLHSTALEYLEDKNEFENEEYKVDETRNLCEKITTCTIDQIFPFVFKYKGYEKILSTLSYSKIIIDEIQGYSPEIVAVIIKGLEMINKMGGKFMIMTATLPRIYTDKMKELNIDFKFGNYIKDIKRHKIHMQDKKIEEDLECIVDRAKKRKVLVIVNTVNKAIELYSILKKEEIENLNLLHSRFIFNDRNEKERKIKEFADQDKNCGVWITTQIVEASLDIDFDYLFTEISTLDSLFQRLGRCYRSRDYDGKEPNIWIYTKEASGIGKVYDESITSKSIELLKEYLENCEEEILDEDSKIKLVDNLYSRETLEGTEFLKKFDAGIEVLENIVDYRTSKEAAQKLLRNIENVTVIPKTVYDENLDLFKEYQEVKDNKVRNKIRREINKLTVSITSRQARIIRDRLIRNPYCEDIAIANLKYDKEIGLLLKTDEEYDLDERCI